MKKIVINNKSIIECYQNIIAYPLFDDIYIVQVETINVYKKEDITKDYNYLYLKQSQIKDISPQNLPESLNFIMVKKDFLSKYENTGFNLPEYEGLISEILSVSDVFDLLDKKECNSEDIMPIIYDRCCERYFSYPDRGWLTHYEKYSNVCYMVTNEDYDLEKLYDFLKEKENIRFKEGIMNIPYYNQDDDSGTKYINFYVKIDPINYELIKDKDLFTSMPKEIIDISSFKK